MSKRGPGRKREQIASFKGQIGDAAVFSARNFDQRLIAIEPYNPSRGTDRLSDTRRDRSGAASGIEHHQAWPQHRRQPPMVARECPPAQHARVGLMMLLQYAGCPSLSNLLNFGALTRAI